MTISTDIGPYTITPLWITEACMDQPRALLVWCYLAAKYADRDTGECWPSRKSLAEGLDMGVNTLDRAIAHLREIGALEVYRRFTASGDPTSNLYRLRFADPDERLPSVGRGTPSHGGTGTPTDGERGTPTSGEQTNNQYEPGIIGTNTSSPEATGPVGLELLPVPRQPNLDKEEREAEIARSVFDAWVQATGRDPSRTKMNDKRRRKVVSRIREGYDEDTLVDAVRGVMKSRWHTGDNKEGKVYTDLVTIMRDGAQVEKFAELEREGGGGGRSAVDRAIAMAGRS